MTRIRTPLLILMALIVSVGGLVPVRTPLDRYATHASGDSHDGAVSSWAKIKLGFAKIIGTSMTYLAPHADVVHLVVTTLTGPVQGKPSSPLILATNIPRPPCC